MLAANPTTFKNDDLPAVDMIEKTLRDGGAVFQDAEDSIGVVMDNVTSSGANFNRANALGMLNQIDLVTSTASPTPVPNTPLTLQALQVELYGKSADEQRQVLDQFRKGSGKFDVFRRR